MQQCTSISKVSPVKQAYKLSDAFVGSGANEVELADRRWHTIILNNAHSPKC